ncbi:DUF1127 domain-containing protein [Celerinatantimonas sp. YJH-8]|uniref:DUF1127 domain-containing protein n=1 Tax=Celerinatantimonas sp. YJH-8 TaxID=3228714 RepID=UPI0038C5D0B7
MSVTKNLYLAHSGKYLLKWIGRVWLLYRRRRLHKQTLRQLSQLSPHTRRDIGLDDHQLLQELAKYKYRNKNKY